MAVDEALLRTADSGCILRFYGWARPAVSLGYAQPLGQGVDTLQARRHHVDVVRRPTGGRAVLHVDEITYAIAAPVDHGVLSGDISSSYRRIADGIRSGLARLGVEATLERAGAATVPKAKGPCFSARARHELLVRGRKLVGSAQRRAGGRLLQHGSLLLASPDRRLWSVLGDGYTQAANASIGLDEVVARPSRRLLMACLSVGIGDGLGLPVRWGHLTRREVRASRRLAARYRDPRWTRRC